MSKGSKVPSSTTSTTAPPAYLEPYLKRAASNADWIFNNEKPNLYPSSTVVPYSADTNQALANLKSFQPSSQFNNAINGITNFSQNPSGLTNSSSQYLTDTVNGKYVNNNPYIDKLVLQAGNDIKTGVNSNFASAGRYGSGAHAGVIADQIGQQSDQIRGAAYTQERNAQQQAALAAPAVQQADLQRLQAGLSAGQTVDSVRRQGIQDLATVGQAQQDIQGQYLQDDINRYNFAQNRNSDALNRYIAQIQGIAPSAGSTGFQSAQNRRNPIAGVAGGALTGLAGYSALSGLGAFSAGAGTAGAYTVGGALAPALAGSTIGGATGGAGLIASAPYLAPFLLGGAALGAFG